MYDDFNACSEAFVRTSDLDNCTIDQHNAFKSVGVADSV